MDGEKGEKAFVIVVVIVIDFLRSILSRVCDSPPTRSFWRVEFKPHAVFRWLAIASIEQQRISWLRSDEATDAE